MWTMARFDIKQKLDKIANAWVIFFLLSCLPLVPAPVPRCSPFIIINKLAEYNSLMSDSNPYFPVPPCEYGGPLQAIRAGDYRSVSVFAEPAKIPLHNFYELIWFLKTGSARLGRIIRGKEELTYDRRILREGYQHHTKNTRTEQFGHGTRRRPEIINNRQIFDKVVAQKWRSFRREGADKHPVNYTPTGPLHGHRKASGPHHAPRKVFSPSNQFNSNNYKFIPAKTQQQTSRHTSFQSPRDTSFQSPRQNSFHAPRESSVLLPRDTSIVLPRDTSLHSSRDTSLHSGSDSPPFTLHSPQDTSLHSPQDTSLHSPQETSLHSPGNSSPFAVHSPRAPSLQPKERSHQSRRGKSLGFRPSPSFSSSHWRPVLRPLAKS